MKNRVLYLAKAVITVFVLAEMKTLQQTMADKIFRLYRTKKSVCFLKNFVLGKTFRGTSFFLTNPYSFLNTNFL